VVLYQLNQLDSAIENYLKDSQITEKLEGKNSSSYASCLSNLGLVYDEKGDLA
jgi:hypothetical protein